MTNHALKEGNIKLTLSINKKVLNKFKKLCEEKGLIISKQIENFMEEKIKNGKS